MTLPQAFQTNSSDAKPNQSSVPLKQRPAYPPVKI
jgi:hypothetical protein